MVEDCGAKQPQDLLKRPQSLASRREAWQMSLWQ